MGPNTIAEVLRRLDEHEQQLHNVQSLLARIEARLAAALAAEPEPEPPPPDPVLESRPYLAAVARGMDHENAYALARELLEQFEDSAPASHARSMRNHGEAPAAAAAAVADLGGGGGSYPDDAGGRARRVWDILHSGMAPTEKAWSEIMAEWQALEDSENSNRTSGTVAGEAAAFELLYPAIVQSARRWKGTATMREFLDPQAIRRGRAPWDLVPESAALEVTLNAEISEMLQAIQKANHPRITVPERVTEKGDDNVTRVENLATFHLRVKRIYQQLQHLQQMGV